jgi:hypothetical protein
MVAGRGAEAVENLCPIYPRKHRLHPCHGTHRKPHHPKYPYTVRTGGVRWPTCPSRPITGVIDRIERSQEN